MAPARQSQKAKDAIHFTTLMTRQYKIQVPQAASAGGLVVIPFHGERQATAGVS
jgi:hypothetical protein